MKTRMKLAFSLFCIAILAVGVYAAVQYTRTVPNQCTIRTSWGISLWRMGGDYVTPIEMITAINWGELDTGIQFSTNQLYGTCLKLHNDGNSIAYVAWEKDPLSILPDGVTLTARYDNGGGFTTLPENNYWITINPGSYSGNEPNSGRIEFTLTIGAYATPGPFTFNILLKAADSQSG